MLINFYKIKRNENFYRLIIFYVYKCLIKKLFINFGPQHQQHMGFTNGVELNGEVFKIAILIWFITWGTEKLIEHKNFLQSTLFWWLDHVSWWHKNMLFFSSWKFINDLCAKALSLILKFWKSSLYSRLFLEITRILNHLLAVRHMLWMLVL